MEARFAFEWVVVGGNVMALTGEHHKAGLCVFAPRTILRSETNRECNCLVVYTDPFKLVLSMREYGESSMVVSISTCSWGEIYLSNTTTGRCGIERACWMRNLPLRAIVYKNDAR